MLISWKFIASWYPPGQPSGGVKKLSKRKLFLPTAVSFVINWTWFKCEDVWSFIYSLVLFKVYYLFCFVDLLSSDRLLRPTPHLASADKRRISWVPYSYIEFNFRLPLGRTCFLYNRVCNNTSENAFIRSNSYETSTAWNIIFSPVW